MIIDTAFTCTVVPKVVKEGIEIWAGFRPVGITEKKTFGPIMSNF